MSEHPDAEQLNSYLDGRQPEYEPHVRACRDCGATVAGLQAVKAAVSAPPATLEDGVRERAIAGALAAYRGTATAPAVRQLSDRTGQRRWRAWAAAASAAAVVAALVGAAAVVRDGNGGGNGDRKRTDVASAPFEKDEGGRATATVREGGDVGDVNDVGTLVSKVTSPPESGGEGAPGSRSLAEAAGDTSAAAPAPPSQSPGIPSPQAIGTRACEIPVRLLNQTLGPLLYFARGRWQGTPALILGFSPTPSLPTTPPGAGVLPPLTVFVVAEDDCRELARTTTP